MRRKLVLGNWKMNFACGESTEVIRQFLPQYKFNEFVRVGFAPSYMAISSVKKALGESLISTGAQDCFWSDKGAFTGCVSVPMLYDQGVEFCLVGHSERRGRFGKLETPESTVGYFAETDETVNLKTKSLVSHGLIAIICVGENLFEREAGHTDSVINAQLQGALEGIDNESAALIKIAYEPVWAIGTGKVCEPTEANRVCGFIRGVIAMLFNKDVAESMAVLYGGSVKANNASDLFSMSDIDGGLVGGASMDANEFAEIVRIAGTV